MNATAQQLLSSSLSGQTRQAYKRSWQKYREYLASSKIAFQFPLSEIDVVNFIAYLFDLNYAPGTITSIISALAFVHKLLKVNDPSESFLVKKVLQGCRKSNASSKDGRLPITPYILDRILHASQTTIADGYNRVLFQAMCSLAFHALLRIGEMTDSQNNLSFDCIQLEQNFLILQFKTFKYSEGSTSTHRVNAKPLMFHCPVRNMARYVAMRGYKTGPLFISTKGTAVSRNAFTKDLQNALNFVGLPTKRYTSHSFRIGAASFMASQGASDAQIKRAGRWSSNAFLAYIRINS